MFRITRQHLKHSPNAQKFLVQTCRYAGGKLSSVITFNPRTAKIKQISSTSYVPNLLKKVRESVVAGKISETSSMCFKDVIECTRKATKCSLKFYKNIFKTDTKLMFNASPHRVVLFDIKNRPRSGTHLGLITDNERLVGATGSFTHTTLWFADKLIEIKGLRVEDISTGVVFNTSGMTSKTAKQFSNAEIGLLSAPIDSLKSLGVEIKEERDLSTFPISDSHRPIIHTTFDGVTQLLHSMVVDLDYLIIKECDLLNTALLDMDKTSQKYKNLKLWLDLIDSMKTNDDLSLKWLDNDKNFVGRQKIAAIMQTVEDGNTAEQVKKQFIKSPRVFKESFDNCAKQSIAVIQEYLKTQQNSLNLEIFLNTLQTNSTVKFKTKDLTDDEGLAFLIAKYLLSRLKNQEALDFLTLDDVQKHFDNHRYDIHDCILKCAVGFVRGSAYLNSTPIPIDDLSRLYDPTFSSFMIEQKQLIKHFERKLEDLKELGEVSFEDSTVIERSQLILEMQITKHLIQTADVSELVHAVTSLVATKNLTSDAAKDWFETIGLNKNFVHQTVSFNDIIDAAKNLIYHA